MKELYDSGLHHPLVAYVAGLALLVAVARRLPFLQAYLVLFTGAILADATVTGAWSPVPANSALGTVLAIVFVVLGDLRVFVLFERYGRGERDLGRVLRVALPVSLVVPVLTGLGSKVVPAMADGRVLFLVYECLLAVIYAGYLRLRQDPSARPDEVRFARWVAAYGVVHYVGWALADVVILTGAEVGHLLRILPNVLYYGGFLPFVYLAADRILQADGALAPRAQGAGAASASATGA